MKTLLLAPYLFALEDDGRPVAVFAPTFKVRGDVRTHGDWKEAEIRTIAEERLGWSVSLDRGACIVRGWVLVPIVAYGRRYAGDYNAWRALDTGKIVDVYNPRHQEPGAGQVCDLNFSTSDGVLLQDHAFEPGGFVHRRGAALAYSPSQKTIAVAEYRSKERLLADLLASALDVPTVEPRIEEPRR